MRASELLKKQSNVLVADSILIVSYHSNFFLTQGNVENNSCVPKVRQLWREGNALTSLLNIKWCSEMPTEE